MASGTAELLTRGDHHDGDPQWSPDGRQLAFVSDRHPNPDLGWRSDIYLVDMRTEGGPAAVSRSRSPGVGSPGVVAGRPLDRRRSAAATGGAVS